MQSTYKTERLLLNKLNIANTEFILELVNTSGWIQFIGDRNVKTNEAAKQYIQKILNNADVSYRVVLLQDNQTAIGVVTLIKRDYLNHHDIGFAFLPAYTKLGYAFEATLTVLNGLLNAKQHKTILATTIKENESSIQLLKKLGFTFANEINNKNEILQVFSVTKEKLYNPQ